MIAVLVPVLDRPERAAPLVESVLSASSLVTRVLFLVTEGDRAQQRAATRAGADVAVVPFPLEGGDYARKINHGVKLTTESWLFQAADDLSFERGWDEIAVSIGERRDAGVVGTDDLGNPLVRRGKHSTHSLIAREYIDLFGTIDQPGLALHEGYWHCWVDNELIETAHSRGLYASARRSRVEHLHHIWRKGDDDDTYRRGQLRYRDDHQLFRARRPLWQ